MTLFRVQARNDGARVDKVVKENIILSIMIRANGTVVLQQASSDLVLSEAECRLITDCV